jgi:hypothetical protein
MPKVDPESGEPMSDAPEGDDLTRGGKVRGDPALEGATSSGRQGLGYSGTGGEADDSSNTELQGQEGGTASGGGT